MALPDTSVVYFNSSMSGAPTLSNTAGLALAVLDACLVDGFGSVTLNSLVISSNVATGTVSAGHNFAMVGATGPVITIAGATPSGLNGKWRIASIPGTTTFTFATEGISDQTATGTITAKRSPAGFTKAYSGSNKAAYRSDDVTGNRMYLRIDDSQNNYCRIRGYETMSDVDTGTGLFPTETQLSGGAYIYKATSTSRAWSLISDGRIIYFYCDAAGSNNFYGGFAFGDLIAFKANDPYAVVLIASPTSTGNHQLGYIATTSASWLARTYTGLGTAITAIRYGHGSSSYIGANTSPRMSYPSPIDLRAHAVQVDCWESLGTGRRGMMPGFFDMLHYGSSYFSVFMTLEGVIGLEGRTIIVNPMASAMATHDLTGPWR